MILFFWTAATENGRHKALTVAALAGAPSKFGPDRLECGLHIVERGAPQINAGNFEGIEEAAADPPIGPHSVVRRRHAT